MTNNQKNIDILIPNFADLGAQRVAINAANGLHGAGHSIRFIVMEASGPFREYLNTEIEVIDLSQHVLNIPKLRIALWPFAYRKLLGEETRTLISFSPLTNIIILLAGWGKPNCKTVIQEHAYQSVALKDRAAHSWMFERIYRNLFIPLYKRATVFLTIAEAIRKDFIKTFGLNQAQTHVIANPLDIEGIQTKANQKPEFTFKPNTPYLLGIGRLAPQKNFHRLLKIFAQVKQQNPSAELIILGEGQDRESLEHLAKELKIESAVHLPGFVKNPYAFLKHSTAFCLTSDWEGLPQVLAEAMVCGTPVVAHACPSGPDEMLEDQKTGRLLPFKDEKAFITALNELLKDDKKRKTLSQNAKTWAEHHYSLKKFVQNYQDMLSKIESNLHTKQK